jgi:hypothetical protein
VTQPSPGLPKQQSLLRRALTARDPGRLHLRFHASVVDRYRETPNSQLVRTRTVGRVAIPGRWSLDVGIADAAGEVHVPFGDLVERLPEDEWPHWVAHVVEQPLSAAFIEMRMSAAACIDDGDTVEWTRSPDTGE